MKMVFVIILIFGLLISPSKAHTFDVGGVDGWTLHPSENYTHWAENYRFEIGDQLVFKYEIGHDSVLLVNRDDYIECNKENPIKTLKDGHSRLKLRKSGPFFFISGHDQNCEKGQKLEIIVLSQHHNHHNDTARDFPGPTAHSPLFRTPSPSPAANKRPTRISPVEPPSRSRSSSPEDGSPSHPPAVEPPSYSSSPSPAAKNLTRPLTHSPSPSPISRHLPIAPESESPTNSYGAPQPAAERHHHVPPPQAHSPVWQTHHGPGRLHLGLRPVFLFGY